MKATRRVLPVALVAALLPAAACNQPTADKTNGVCKSNGEACAATTDCCSGFSCESAVCVFNGGGNGSAGGSSGGGSTGGSTGVSTGSSGSTGTHGGNSTSSGGAGGSSGGNFVTATHTMTQVTNQGGAVLTNPVLVTITYDNDPNQADVEAFGKFLATSQWYSQVSTQFQLGTASEINVELPGSAPATTDDATIQGAIGGLLLDGGVPGLNGGSVSLNNAVYMMYYPASTSISVQGTPMCQFSAGGYHGESQVGTTANNFAYAVVTDCEGQLPVASPHNIEWSASHEFIEAASDPFPQTGPAFQINDQTNPWSVIGGEVGDLCTGIFPQWSEGSYPAIQRVWNNASAAAGGDPCLPEPPSDPYYSTDLEPQTFVPVAAGGQTTFTVTGWSTAAVPDWQVFASPYEATFTPTATITASTLNNGQTTTLTVGVPAGTAAGGSNYATVTIVSGNSQTDFTSTIVGVYVP